MVRPLRVEYPGAFYHVINRGNMADNRLKSRPGILKNTPGAALRATAICEKDSLALITDGCWTATLAAMIPAGGVNIANMF